MRKYLRERIAWLQDSYDHAIRKRDAATADSEKSFWNVHANEYKSRMDECHITLYHYNQIDPL